MKVFCYLFVAMMLFVVNFDICRALSCALCDTNAECPPLPANCETGRKPCACCDECRGKEGDTCGSFTVPCEEGLFCVDQRGRHFQSTPWWTFTSGGVCKAVHAGNPLCECAPPPLWDDLAYPIK